MGAKYDAVSFRVAPWHNFLLEIDGRQWNDQRPDG